MDSFLITDPFSFHINKETSATITLVSIVSSIIYVLVSRVDFSVQVCNHSLALDIIFFTLFLNLHSCIVVHAVNLITNSMGSMHRLFHFTCVVQFELTNSESSLRFFALISDFFVIAMVSPFVYHYQSV
jgi:hypothetical protein